MSVSCLTSLGISLFFAARGIITDLRQVVDLTEIKHNEREDKIISEGTEDGEQGFSQFITSETNDISSQARHPSQALWEHEP